MSDLHIRRIEANHTELLTELWRSAFPGDPSEFIESFFLHLPKNSVTLAGECDGELVTMLFLLPAEARFRGKAYPVRYLYAGCTHPRYRGRGYYRELMAVAAQAVSALDEQAIYLHPADDMLTVTYQRLGYRVGIFGGEHSHANKTSLACEAVDDYMQKRDKLINFISQNTVFWNTAEEVTRFFVADAVARGVRMSVDEDCVELALNNTVIESVTSDYSHKNKDYCLWLPIGDTPLTALMADYDGVTGLVGD